jgi:hypothetical protein
MAARPHVCPTVNEGTIQSPNWRMADGDELAIEDWDADRNRRKGAGDGRVLPSGVREVTREKGDAGAILEREGTVAIPLDFVGPGLARRECGSERCQHRLGRAKCHGPGLWLQAVDSRHRRTRGAPGTVQNRTS